MVQQTQIADTNRVMEIQSIKSELPIILCGVLLSNMATRMCQRNVIRVAVSCTIFFLRVTLVFLFLCNLHGIAYYIFVLYSQKLTVLNNCQCVCSPYSGVVACSRGKSSRVRPPNFNPALHIVNSNVSVGLSETGSRAVTHWSFPQLKLKLCANYIEILLYRVSPKKRNGGFSVPCELKVSFFLLLLKKNY